jgi:hypothetical protein
MRAALALLRRASSAPLHDQSRIDAASVATVPVVRRPAGNASSASKPNGNEMKNNILAGGVAAILTVLGAATSAEAHNAAMNQDNPLSEKVRAANSRFVDVSVATAEGYAPIPCASSPTGNGAMGIHYVNAAYLADDKIDLARPEAVMYEPMPGGKLALVAVEYITSKGPAALEGQLFNFNSTPNRYGLGAFYELHVWAWRPNPTGTFADMNPDVSCDLATSGGG